MAGTLLNTVFVLLGSSLGLFLGSRLSARIQDAVVTGLALIVFVIGLENASRSQNIIVPLLSVALGIVVGELLDLDGALKRMAGALQARLSRGQADGADARARFINGFVTATLVFSVGPLTIVGSIQDGMGLESGFQFLLIKSALDFFTSMAFAASFGIGVVFSAIGVLGIQGAFALFGAILVMVMSDPAATADFAQNPIILELTAVGGVLLLGLALTMAEIKAVRVANYLPALLIAPLLVWIASLLGITL